MCIYIYIHACVDTQKAYATRYSFRTIAAWTLERRPPRARVNSALQVGNQCCPTGEIRNCAQHAAMTDALCKAQARKSEYSQQLQLKRWPDTGVTANQGLHLAGTLHGIKKKAFWARLPLPTMTILSFRYGVTYVGLLAVKALHARSKSQARGLSAKACETCLSSISAKEWDG